MLNKQDIINRLTEKQYPKNEYWINAGSGLVMHGVKSETRDIDIGCSPILAQSLLKNGAEWLTLEDGKRKIIVDSDIDLIENGSIDLIDVIIEIEGFRVASIECIRRQKIKYSRPNDLTDIKLIDEFLNGRG